MSTVVAPTMAVVGVVPSKEMKLRPMGVKQMSICVLAVADWSLAVTVRSLRGKSVATTRDFSGLSQAFIKQPRPGRAAHVTLAAFCAAAAVAPRTDSIT